MPTSQDHTSMTVPTEGRAPRRGTRLTIAAAIVAALVVSAPVLAATGAKGAYTGKTAQGLPVKLSKPVKGGRRFTYQARMQCSDGSTWLDAPFVDLVAIKKGKFRSRYKSDNGATVTNVRGTIKGKKASGTVHITERYGATPNAAGNFPLDPHGTTFCQSTNVKWTAKAK
jgi:hypothetical protein